MNYAFGFESYWKPKLIPYRGFIILQFSFSFVKCVNNRVHLGYALASGSKIITTINLFGTIMHTFILLIISIVIQKSMMLI